MFFNWLCIIFGFVSILYSLLYLARKSNATVVGLGIATGFLLLAFGNLDKFQSINAVGFEATIKESLAETDSSVSRLERSVEPLITGAILKETMADSAVSKRLTQLTEAYFDLEIVDSDVEREIRPLIVAESRKRVQRLQEKYSEIVDTVLTQRSSDNVINLNQLIVSLPDSCRTIPEVQELKAFYIRHKLPLDGGPVSLLLK